MSLTDRFRHWFDYETDVHAKVIASLGTVPDDEYRSNEGERFRNRIEDLLTQLFGHSGYHRGQIASIVRRLGGEPAVTDYVFWSRERI